MKLSVTGIMNRVNIYLPCLLMLFLTISCTGNKTGDDGRSVFTVKVPNKQTEDQEFDSFFKFSHYVVLDNSQDALVGSLNKIQFDENNIYIFCNIQQDVLIFNKEGKFISRFNKRGKGSGEYISASDMEVDGHDIYILDYINAVLRKYDIDGTPLSSEKITYSESFKLLGKGLTALNLDNGGASSDRKSLPNNYAVYKNGELTYQGIPYSEHLLGHKRRFGSGRSAFYSYNDSIFSLFTMSDTVYNIDKITGGLKPYISYVFPLRKPAYDAPRKDVVEYFNNQGSGDYISDLYNYMKLGNYDLVSYNKNDRRYYVISKGDELIFNGMFNTDENGIPLLPVSYMDNTTGRKVRLVSTVNRHVLSSISKFENPRNKANKGLINEILSKTEDNDNPILLFYDWVYR